MTIRYHKIKRRLVPSDESSEIRVFPVVTYKYGKAADLKEIAKKIAKQSILGEGEVYNMLSYFCSLLQETLHTAAMKTAAKKLLFIKNAH